MGRNGGMAMGVFHGNIIIRITLRCHQTWLAMASREILTNPLAGKSIDFKWWIFQLAMFCPKRVNGKPSNLIQFAGSTILRWDCDDGSRRLNQSRWFLLGAARNQRVDPILLLVDAQWMFIGLKSCSNYWGRCVPHDKMFDMLVCESPCFQLKQINGRQ